MAFTKKMMGFPVWIWSHSRTKPNCRQKELRKFVSHFLQGITLIKLVFNIHRDFLLYFKNFEGPRRNFWHVLDVL